MADIYRDEAQRMAQFCFSGWNREVASPSLGSFDRQYWGWKKKDFSDSALQAAVALCVRFAESQRATASLPAWLEGYVDYLENIQHGDGSFDQFYPNEHTPGVVHDMLSALLIVLRSPHLGDDPKQRLEKILRRAVAYTLAAEEDHGEIANHFAGYSWELIHYGSVMGDSNAIKAGRECLARTLSLQHPAEAWFCEYDGADAGYQTRLLTFLTRIAALTDDMALWDICARGARFVETLLMPDNSLHPMLGVRSTALIYPSGFERLAAHDPAFGPLADRIYAAWSCGGAPLPSMTDMENGIRLAEDAFEASGMRALRAAVSPGPATPVSFDFPEAGLHGRAIRGGQLYVASKLGGVIALYEAGVLAAEDAGYVIRRADGTRWLTRRAGGGRLVEITDNQMVVEAEFVQSLHEDMTPAQLLLLRFLNLTVLRSQWIGDVFRKLVVRRLISGRRTLPLLLRRKISWGDGGVAIEDCLVADQKLSLDGTRLFRCRRITGNHMASARYFTMSELHGDAWLEEVEISAIFGGPLLRRIGRA